MGPQEDRKIASSCPCSTCRWVALQVSTLHLHRTISFHNKRPSIEPQQPPSHPKGPKLYLKPESPGCLPCRGRQERKRPRRSCSCPACRLASALLPGRLLPQRAVSARAAAAAERLPAVQGQARAQATAAQLLMSCLQARISTAPRPGRPKRPAGVEAAEHKGPGRKRGRKAKVLGQGAGEEAAGGLCAMLWVL